MKRFAYAVLILLLFALYIYFFGTSWLAELTGLSPRAVSLSAGFSVMLLAVTGIMMVRLSASRPRDK